MRIRSIRPEFWSSEDVASLDWDTRLIFTGLWCYVDDNGVGRDNEKLITADLFPLEEDPRETLARVSRALSALSDRGLIERYTVDGRAYLHVTTFATHQRVDKPGKPRYPLPTCGDAVIRDTLATPSRDSRESLAPGEGEKGRRGEGEKGRRGEAQPLSVGTAVAVPDEPREDVEALCTLMADLVESNGCKRPTVTKQWREECRRMLDIDHREPDKAAYLMRWATQDPFWRANILSIPAFRKKYEQLRLKALKQWEERRGSQRFGERESLDHLDPEQLLDMVANGSLR